MPIDINKAFSLPMDLRRICRPSSEQFRHLDVQRRTPLRDTVDELRHQSDGTGGTVELKPRFARCPSESVGRSGGMPTPPGVSEPRHAAVLTGRPVPLAAKWDRAWAESARVDGVAILGSAPRQLSLDLSRDHRVPLNAREIDLHPLLRPRLPQALPISAIVPDL